MVDSIQSSTAPLMWPNNDSEPLSLALPTKEDLHAAEEEVASLYYLTSLKSLAEPPTQQNPAVKACEAKAIEKSFLGKAKDWLWELFGWTQKPPIPEVESESNQKNEDIKDLASGGTPKLQPPEAKDQKRISQAISDLHRELGTRLKEIAEFEEEMRNSSSNNLDKLIFIHLVNSSLNQKKLKESGSLMAQEEVINLHKKNQELHKAYFNLVDLINSENKARGVLKWINVGLTAITVGGTFAGFAFGGPAGIFAVGMPLALMGKGSTMLTDGILKYKSDVRTGELVVVKQETKDNSSAITEKLSDRQALQEVTGLLKSIRNLLDNQAKAERASFNRAG